MSWTRVSRTSLTAGVLSLAGVGTLVILALTQDFPQPWFWALLTIGYAILEYRSRGEGDVVMSGGMMALFAAGIVFALQSESSAALGLAAMAAFGFPTRRDVRERRIAVPLMNFGQVVIAAAVSGLLLDRMLDGIAMPYAVTDYLVVALASATAALVFTILQVVQVVVAVRIIHRRPDSTAWRWIMTAGPSYMFVGTLGGLLGITYLQVPSILPLILLLFLVDDLVVNSFSQLRQAHEATLRGFVKALEAKDLYTRGHTERVAYFAELIGRQLRFRGAALERIKWAALIHDVGKLAVPRELIQKRGRLDDEEYEELQTHAHMVEDLMAEVDFLKPMVEIASGHHSRYDGGGYGGTGHKSGKRPSMESRILAVADAFDAMTSTRSYRVALSQEVAFEELTKNAGGQFDPDVVNALIKALDATGERYGSIHRIENDDARALAEGRETARG